LEFPRDEYPHSAEVDGQPNTEIDQSDATDDPQYKRNSGTLDQTRRTPEITGVEITGDDQSLSKVGDESNHPGADHNGANGRQRTLGAKSLGLKADTETEDDNDDVVKDYKKGIRDALRPGTRIPRSAVTGKLEGSSPQQQELNKLEERDPGAPSKSQKSLGSTGEVDTQGDDVAKSRGGYRANTNIRNDDDSKGKGGSESYDNSKKDDKAKKNHNAKSDGDSEAKKLPHFEQWVDNEAAENVFTSLVAALPEYELPPTAKGSKSRQPPGSSAQSHGGPKNKDNSKAPQSLGDTPEVPDKLGDPPKPLPSVPGLDQDEINKLKNYHWHKEVYNGLQLDQNSIRLATIQSGNGAESVSVAITVHSLDDVTAKYEALSYVWGDPEPAKYITVNGREKVPVNSNLFDALVSLRLPDATRCIWIDALCLNQNSPAEKSRQVQKMGKIYGLAKTVNVFLGRPSEVGQSSVDTLFEFLTFDGPNSIFEGKNLMADGETFEYFCERSSASPDDVCKGLVELCLQPWWNRIWTLVSAIRPLLCLGATS
jgi:hypothetical protein